MANNTISQVEINGTTYDLLDAATRSTVTALQSSVTALQSSVNNKVSKTGDTITGDIWNTGDGRVYNIKGINNNLALANNGVSGTIYPGYQVLDNQGRISIRLEAVTKNNGENGWNLYARNYNTSGTQTGQKGISCTLNKAGTATWNVSDAANFRSAIGAQAAGNYAPHGWTQKATSTNDNALTYNLSGCTEVMFAAIAGTSYVGSVILPVSLLHASTYREVYLSGGTTIGDPLTPVNGRGFAVKAITTRATIAARVQDNTAVGCTWYVFAR